MPKMKPPTPPKQPSMNATDWRISTLVPVFQVTPTSFGFDFPTLPTEAGYCITNLKTTLIGKLRMSGNITGESPVFGANEWDGVNGIPPNFRFLIWRLDNSLNTTEWDRWWSNPDHVVCDQGLFFLEVPLTPDRWSSVLGHMGNESGSTRSKFNAALNMDQIGFSFGAGSNFGHGVGLQSGTAKFVCSEFSIVP